MDQATLQRIFYGALALLTLTLFGVGLAVGLGHTHAADPDGGDLEAAEHSLLHLILPVERVVLNSGCYRNRLAGEIASGTLGR